MAVSDVDTDTASLVYCLFQGSNLRFYDFSPSAMILARLRWRK